MASKHSLTIVLVLFMFNVLVLSKRKEEHKHVGHDKSNQTAGHQNFERKESGEKILKGIWLVLGIFLIVACFLLCRFSYKGISVLCLHQG